MIIKLQSPFSYARHKETRLIKPLTYKERIKADRIVLAIIFLMVIIGAAVFA